MTKKIKIFYFRFTLIILVAVVSIVLYNVMQEDTNIISVDSNFVSDRVPIIDPGPTNITCSNSSDCTGVCVADECLVSSCNKTTNTCICLGI